MFKIMFSSKKNILSTIFVGLIVSLVVTLLFHKYSEVLLVFRDQNANLRLPADIAKPSLEVRENYQSLIYEIFKELLILGLLVFLWEFLHEKFKQKQIEENQINSLVELLFFIDEVKVAKEGEHAKPTEPELPEMLKSKFYSEVCTSYEDIESNDVDRIHGHNISFSDADLSTFSSEALLYNVEETLNGIQDIIIEGQEKNSELHKAILSVYKETRLLMFLVKRFSFLQERESCDEKNLETLKKNKINVLIGVCYSLNRIQSFVAELKSIRDGKQAKIQDLYISRSVLVRIASAMKCKVDDANALRGVYELVLKTQDTHKANTRIFIHDPQLRSVVAYFIAIRDCRGTEIKPSEFIKTAA